MSTTKVEYAVRIKRTGQIIPINEMTAERFKGKPDGPLMELMARIIVVSDWQRAENVSIDGKPVTECQKSS